MNNKYAIVSSQVPQICDKLKELGFKLIYTECVDEFISYEKHHADMQCISVDDKLFVLKNAKTTAKLLSDTGFNVTITNDKATGKYPDNIKLNALVLNKRVVGKINNLDKTLIDYIKDKEYECINVNQGYTACSCCKINNNAVITSDISIYNTLLKHNIDVLKISEGNIVLHGSKGGEHGFIGGASATFDNNVIFFGNIMKHPDYLKINEFCEKHTTNIINIENIPLTDIGGSLLLKNSQ